MCLSQHIPAVHAKSLKENWSKGSTRTAGIKCVPDMCEGNDEKERAS